jgi:F-type H+-transporting ATPase subunit b
VPATLATFLFELVNFLLLAGLLGWLLFKPVRAMLAARQAATAKQAEEAATHLADAERLKKELQQRTAAFEQEMAETRSRRLAAAGQEADAIVARARAAAERELERGQRVKAHLEQTEIESLAVVVAEAARDAVGDLLASLGSPTLDAGLVRAACDRIATLDTPTLGAVDIDSAAPLGDDDRAALTAALKNRASSVAFHVRKELGAGLTVTTARGLVDASAAGIAAAAERRLRTALAEEEPAVTR